MEIIVKLMTLELGKGIVSITGFWTAEQKTCTCSGGNREPDWTHLLLSFIAGPFPNYLGLHKISGLHQRAQVRGRAKRLLYRTHPKYENQLSLHTPFYWRAIKRFLSCLGTTQQRLWLSIHLTPGEIVVSDGETFKVDTCHWNISYTVFRQARNQW